MTALNFPDSPTNGEVYEGYIYDSSDNVWNRLPEAPGINLENLGNVTTIPSAGDTLIYDGSNWLNTPQKNRNLLFNGAMQVHQRGTSVTGITGDGYQTADRWRTFSPGTTGTWTQTLENDGPTGSGLTKSTKLLWTTAKGSLAADDRVTFVQALEGQNLQEIAKGTSESKPLTLSFWVKSNVTGTYIVNPTADGRGVSAAYSVLSSGVWEKKVITFPADFTGTIANNNTAGLVLNWFLLAGSNFTSGTLQTSWASTVTADRAVGQVNLAAATNNYWQITGVQLETGEVATPFEFKPFGVELAECQRYLPAWTYQSGNDGVGFGYSFTTTQSFIEIPIAVTPRTKPTGVSVSAMTNFVLRNGSNNGGTPLSIALNISSSGQSQSLIVTTTGGSPTLTVGQGALLFANGAAQILFTGCEL